MTTWPSAQSLPIDEYPMDIDPLGQFYQELGIAVQMVDFGRFAFGEGGHRLHIGPIGDGREPRLLAAVLAQQLDAERGLLEGWNTLGANV